MSTTTIKYPNQTSYHQKKQKSISADFCPICAKGAIPNAETLESFAELENGNYETFTNLDDLWTDLED